MAPKIKSMKMFPQTYLAVIESCVAFVKPSNARFKKQSPYPRGALGCANLLIVLELVWNKIKADTRAIYDSEQEFHREA